MYFPFSLAIIKTLLLITTDHPMHWYEYVYVYVCCILTIARVFFFPLLFSSKSWQHEIPLNILQHKIKCWQKRITLSSDYGLKVDFWSFTILQMNLKLFFTFVFWQNLDSWHAKWIASSPWHYSKMYVCPSQTNMCWSKLKEKRQRLR